MFINNLAYEASAGSGKTFMLVVRYLSLLFLGASPSKILALTFTNKAANEMQERIVSTLEELEHRGELDEIVKVTGFSKEYLLQNRQRILNEFLNSHTKIMTIDSFFTSILRKFSLYASLMPDFSTFSSQHELKLLSRFLKEVSVAGKKETLVTLSLQSNKRLTDIFGLLDEFYIKFSELKDIEFKKQDYLEFEQQAMLYMSELRKIVESCKDASSTAIKSVQAESFDELIAKAWIGRESLNYSTFKKCFTPVMDELLFKIQEALKNQNRAKEQNFFAALKELSDIYKKSKKALYMDDSELSFSDVTYLVYEILNLINDSEFLYFRLDSQIEHMLLDEFQDTSILQYEILKPLIDEITSGKGIFDNGSFFFVGDVKQSIYRFRGGVSALFDTVRSENNTHVEKLLTNYRSQKEIVEFVNSVFVDKIKNYTPQLVKADANGGYVEVIQNDELLEEVTTQVKRLISLGADINEIAVLCATNGDGEEVKQTLHSVGIDVVTETTTKLINQKSVKAVLEYLKYQYFGEDIYMYNFFALISGEVKSIKRVDFNKVKILDIVKDAIKEFGLFSDDFNLVRFLNALSNQSDIEALLFEYERLDMSAAASELSGVRVLTVHKSKGLEYEHVIVMDRLKKAPPSRDAIIYEYEGITLKNIYLRIKGRDEIDKNYANALKKEKALIYEDSLNALYVAFTRAKKNLFVVLKSKDSMFDILDLTLKASCIKLGILTCKQKNTNLAVKTEFQPLDYKPLYYGTQSDILALEQEQYEDLKSINFGLAMHYMLEMLGEFKEQNIPHAKDMMMNKYGYTLENDEIEEILGRVKMLLENKEFISLVNGECYREKAIRYKKNLRYIDLLVKNESRWSVIDYKSSLSYARHHVKQVSYYINAVKEITGDEVDGYICYLLEKSVKIVKIF
ncbi:MAG: recombinase RecB [Sulfurimonas sp. RIFOXYD12_FULL_33_39]|uniref:RecB-like helicase n=1 Tax=unclassified Sulfurimonas TaxID=2623549 RepID=UPI0008C3B228|nr:MULTISPECIES: RecB-like helicase [unclassified Sulfurimonas]OHE09824.1 MAG: recombinase RecB [Sulfurimonas sp. RIFOXYD12_FULL_33_39]OHE13668.1 MAG: recombinase RecB [Sulfurimonas sp. RIFOXYD2_FULL_34_21]DAB28124.1 MAG TPA: recombinase RecB [Sulfurimonas sp. UBA10385]